MTWTEEIETELGRAREAERAGNSGRARTAARRAVGIAMEEYRRQHLERSIGRTAPAQLQWLALDPQTPQPVRGAAERLRARISADFQSPSVDPIADARIIIAFVQSQIRGESHSHR